jgi:hypothetical protein
VTAITVLTHKRIPAPDGENFDERDADAQAGDLVEALERHWHTDAHFAAYAPFMAGDGDDAFALRLSYGVIGQDGCAAEMVALIGDCDDPVTHGTNSPARKEWRAQIRPRLDASGLAHYETRGGFRVLATLAKPVVITNRSDTEAWKARYLAWCDSVQSEHDVILDRRCCDWTRLYRLPNVQRDGRPARAPVVGEIPVVDLPEAVSPPVRDDTPSAAMPSWSVDDMAEAVRLATTAEVAMSGQDGQGRCFAAACAIANALDGDEDATRAVLTQHYNPRCVPPWTDAELRHKARDAAREASTTCARLARTNARVLRGESASQRTAEAPDAAGAVFLITPKAKDIFVYDPRIEAYRECALASLVITLRASGADELVTMCGPRGGQLPPQTLLDNGPTAIVREAVADYSSTSPCLYDRENERVLLGITCPAVEPHRSDAVAVWLEALAGDEVAAVHEWIASTRQDQTHRLATALCLVGAHGAGKTVFAQVCARLWGSQPVELGHVVKQFNATMARCPIVLDDECKCLARRTVTTEEFRVYVQNRDRMYEPKNKEMRPLIGAQRFILTANDLSDIRFANALGHGAIDALAERITVVSLDDEQSELARVALDAVRLPGGALDWGALMSHFEYLRRTVTLPGEHVRFLGQGADRARARQAVLAHAANADQAAYERIGQVATGAKPGAVFIAQGSVWVKVRAFADALALSSGADRWDLARVQRALEPIRGRREAVWVDGATVRAREIDTARLVEVAGLDPVLVARTLAT